MGQPNKLLLDIKGQPMVRRAVSLYADIFDKVSVITGFEADKIEASLEDLRVETIFNSDFERGQQSSVFCGLIAVSAECDVMIVLADQPFLTPNDISNLTRFYRSGSRDKALIPYFGGQRGHPVIVPHLLITNFKRAAPNITLRSYLDAYSDKTAKYDAPNDHFITDIDKLSDVKAYGL